jgi:UDP-2-acetamido-2,6-beta-L-arabino-hexul-4-ose reductase
MGKEAFNDGAQLVRDVSSCDVIVHFAGMNRGEDAELFNTNVKLTGQLIDALKKAGRAPHVVFSSSTQIYKNTVYGDSKIECSKRLKQWSEDHGAVFTNVVLPNIFGEGGKPFYNSVVSTFCHQIANQQQPQIKVDADIEFLHAGELAVKIYQIIQEKTKGDLRLAGHVIKVSDLLKKIQDFAAVYEGQMLPAIKDDFDQQLFNTYRYYLYPQFYPIFPQIKRDPRGEVFETVKSLGTGQCFISTTKPGITRGNHFHLYKFERFLVIKGTARIKIRKLFSSEAISFEVDGQRPGFIDIPTLHVHNITNTGADELITLFWSGEIFDPDSPDTFMEMVEVVNEKN